MCDVICVYNQLFIIPKFNYYILLTYIIIIRSNFNLVNEFETKKCININNSCVNLSKNFANCKKIRKKDLIEKNIPSKL